MQPVEKLAIVRVIRINLDGALCVLKGVYLVAEIHIGNGAQIVPASVTLGKRNLRERGESFVVSAVAYVVDSRAALCALLRLLIRAVAAETTESAIAAAVTAAVSSAIAAGGAGLTVFDLVVCGVYLVHLRRRGCIAGVAVRMIFLRKLSVSFFYLLVRCIS